MTKTQMVKDYLINNGTLTSWDAIHKFNATRLSAIIFNLRKKGMIIEDEWDVSIDENGNKSRFVHYTLINKEDYFAENMNHIPRID